MKRRKVKANYSECVVRAVETVEEYSQEGEEDDE